MQFTLPEPRHPATGLFIAVEGGDGAGKSTQVRLLAEALSARGHSVICTREPGGTAVGRQIREVLLHGEDVSPRAEAMLYAADRAHHADTVIHPALDRGEVVLTDRYMDSSMAYQSAARGLRQDDIRGLSMWATGGLVPHLTVLLDLPVTVGRARLGESLDRLEREGAEFHERVRSAFLELAAAAADRYIVLDATTDPEDLHAAVLEAVDQRHPDLGGGDR